MKKFALLGMMLLASGPAFAQTPGPAVAAPSGNADTPPAVDPRVDQRITAMHEKLKITPAEQSDWDAFAEVMRSNMTSIDQAYQQRRASVSTMSAPENMRNFAQIEQERAQGIQKLAASFQTLYDVMSDDQKKTADSLFRHYDQSAASHKMGPKHSG